MLNQTKKPNIRDLIAVIAIVVSLITTSLVGAGLITPEQKIIYDDKTGDILNQVGDLTDQINALYGQLDGTNAALNASQLQLLKTQNDLANAKGQIISVQNSANQANQQATDAQNKIVDLNNLIDQPVGSTLSTMRKGYGFQVSFATNNGVPDHTLVLQSGVNGSVVLLGYSATNYTYVAAKAISVATAINGSIYFGEGDYSYASMVIPDIPLGVSVFIDSGAYGYSRSNVYGTLTDYHNSVFYVDGQTMEAPYTYLIYSKTVGATTTYYAKASNGSISFTSSNLVAGVVQPCQDLLTLGGSISIKSGSVYAWEATLNVTNPAVTLCSDSMGYHGKTSLKATATCTSHMINIAGGVYCTTIRNLGFDGSNIAYNIINYNGNELTLEDLEIAYAKNWGISDGGDYLRAWRIVVDYCTTTSKGGVYISGTRGSYNQVGSSGNYWNWYVAPTASGYTFDGCLGQAATKDNFVVGGTFHQFYGCTATLAQEVGLIAFGAQNCTFNFIVRDNSQATTNTSAAVLVEAQSGVNSTNNVFNLIVSNTLAKIQKDGYIENYNEGDYNIVMGQFYGCGRYDVAVRGVHTHYAVLTTTGWLQNFYVHP